MTYLPEIKAFGDATYFFLVYFLAGKTIGEDFCGLGHFIERGPDAELLSPYFNFFRHMFSFASGDILSNDTHSSRSVGGNGRSRSKFYPSSTMDLMKLSLLHVVINYMSLRADSMYAVVARLVRDLRSSDNAISDSTQSTRRNNTVKSNDLDSITGVKHTTSIVGSIFREGVRCFSSAADAFYKVLSMGPSSLLRPSMGESAIRNIYIYICVFLCSNAS